MKTQIEDLGNIGLIIDDWDISKSFRPRTLTVDYRSWIAYVSRKAVPANIDITDAEYWKPIFRLDATVAFDYNAFKDFITEEFNKLKVLVDTFLVTSGGTALDNKFGDNEFIGVNQKVLTESINKLWDKISDMTGEPTQGINMTVTPNYFINANGCDVHITASSAQANGKFEKIEFIINGEKIAEAENVEFFETDTRITRTSDITCKAKIMGIEYEKTKTIQQFKPYWLGAGANYQAVMINDNLRPVTDGLRGAFDITVNDDGDKFFVILDNGYEGSIIRIDMNGFEIPITRKSDITDYIVYESDNGYIVGTYNIDING